MNNFIDTTQLAQNIADLVVSTFKNVDFKAAKPSVRLNGVMEWTVLAGLVAVHGDSLIPLTLATGVKTMPNQVRERSLGLIVHDLHAEILCLRMFNWYLMEEVRRLKESETRKPITGGQGNERQQKLKSMKLSDDLLSSFWSDTSCCTPVIEGFHEKRSNFRITEFPFKESEHDQKTRETHEIRSQNNNSFVQIANSPEISLLYKHKQEDPKYSLREGIKLALYISEAPCGDASMALVSTEGEDWQLLDLYQGPLRGRASFNKVGIVRTKPGRSDSRISYSKSCSDKLCLKQFTGVLNAISSTSIEPIFLLYLVVPRLRFVQEDFDRCFSGRLIPLSADLPPAHTLQCIAFERDEFPFRKKDETASPLPLSFVHCEVNKMSQVLLNGVKNGAHMKKRAPTAKGASILCRHKLWERSEDLIGQFKDYESIKRNNHSREALKSAVKKQLGLWPSSARENFQLD